MNYKKWKTFKLNIDKAPISNDPISLFPSQFFGVICGPPNSGKSTLVTETLFSREGWFKKFDLTLFMSPYEVGDLNLKDDRKRDDFDVEWIKEMIAYHKTKKEVRNVLIFMDDVISDVHGNQNKKDVIDLFFNRRKIVEGVTISIVLSTQKFTMLPSRFRSSLDFIILFKVPNNDFKIIKDQHLSSSHPSHDAIIHAHWNQDPHNFIYIRINPHKIFLNYEKAL